MKIEISEDVFIAALILVLCFSAAIAAIVATT